MDAHGYRSVVYNSFSSTVDEWRETRLLKEEELALLPQVQHAPVIFQEYVPAAYDLRVTVIADRVFPVAIHAEDSAYPVDCRIDIGNNRIEAVEIPEPLANSLQAVPLPRGGHRPADERDARRASPHGRPGGRGATGRAGRCLVSGSARRAAVAGGPLTPEAAPR